MEVRQIHSRHVIRVSANASVIEAAALMRDHDVSCLVVVEPRTSRPLGVITCRHLVVVIADRANDLDAVRVKEIMTGDPVLAYEDDSVEAVIDQMHHNAMRALPVVDEDDQLVGIIAHDALVERFAALLQRLVRSPEPTLEGEP